MDRVSEHQKGPASQQSMQAMPCPICSAGLKPLRPRSLSHVPNTSYVSLRNMNVYSYYVTLYRAVLKRISEKKTMNHVLYIYQLSPKGRPTSCPCTAPTIPPLESYNDAGAVVLKPFSTAAKAFHQAEMRAPHRLCQFNATRSIGSMLRLMSMKAMFSLCFPVALLFVDVQSFAGRAMGVLPSN